MPTIKDRSQQQIPVNAQVALPPDFPDIPQEILDRFPSAKDWQQRLEDFWTKTNQAIQTAQVQIARQVNSLTVASQDSFKVYDLSNTPRQIFAVDGTGIRLGNVLVVDTAGRTLHVGVGEFANANTPIYMDILGRFSLGDVFAYDASTDTLALILTTGTIAGFLINPTTISDAADVFGLSSEVTVGDDIRIWAGDIEANKATAPFRLTESGVVFIGTGAFNGTVGATTPATGTFTTLSATGATSLGTYGTNDYMRIFGAAAGGGASAVALNNGATDYAPLSFVGDPVYFYARNGVATNTLVGTFSSTGLVVTGALSATGAITSTVNAGLAFGASGATTGQIYLLLQNTGGATYWGLEDSTGSAFGATPYSSIISTPTAFEVLVASTTILSASASGINFTGDMLLTGNFITIVGTTNAAIEARFNAGSAYIDYDIQDNMGGTPGLRFLRNSTAGTILTIFSAGTSTICAAFNGTNVQIPGLSGIGTRPVLADATGNLSAP